MTQPTGTAELTAAYDAFLDTIPDLIQAIGVAVVDPETGLGIYDIVESLVEIVGYGTSAGLCIASYAGLP
jgi:hypothetical protein